jgi:hypothetical protein
VKFPSFGRELDFDHVRNQAMLVAQKLHHFERSRDWRCGRLSGMTPLANHQNPTEAAGEQSGSKAR